MLELGALDVDVGGLDAGALKLGLGLVDVGLAGDAALEAVVGDAIGLFVGLHGIEQELLVGIVGAGFEVVNGKLGLEAELRGLEVGRGSLSLFLRKIHSSADAAPEIDLVVQVEWELEVGGAVVVGWSCEVRASVRLATLR